MVRIAGLNLPNDKKIVVALTYLYGIGLPLSQKILEKLKINPDLRTKELTEEQENVLRKEVEDHFKVEGNLRREVFANIKRLKDIRAYRGTRHAKGLTVRGQRTKTNSRTVRGNGRKTVGSGRKPTGQKT